MGNAELLHGGGQVAGLLGHALGGGAGLFDQCCVLLRDRIELRHRLVDLLDARQLLGAGRADLADHVACFGNGPTDAGHGLARGTDLRVALGHLGRSRSDQALDFYERTLSGQLAAR